MVTILTALRGNPVLSNRWATAVKASGVEKIIAATNNPEDVQLVESIGGRAFHVRPFVGSDDEVARINYIAAIYADLIMAAGTQFVILWDDDVLPPDGSVKRLVEAIAEQTESVAGIVTVQPYHYEGSEHRAVLFWKPFQRRSCDLSSVPASGLHRVWGGGTGFSIWRRAHLLKTLPWTTKDDNGIDGWDQDLARKLYELNLTTHVEASILCRHDHLP